MNFSSIFFYTYLDIGDKHAIIVDIWLKTINL